MVQLSTLFPTNDELSTSRLLKSPFDRWRLRIRSLLVVVRALTQKCAPIFELAETVPSRFSSLNFRRNERKYPTKMTFGDVRTPKGLEELNNFLAANSYVTGWVHFGGDEFSHFRVMFRGTWDTKSNFANLLSRSVQLCSIKGRFISFRCFGQSTSGQCAACSKMVSSHCIVLRPRTQCLGRSSSATSSRWKAHSGRYTSCR